MKSQSAIPVKCPVCGRSAKIDNEQGDNFFYVLCDSGCLETVWDESEYRAVVKWNLNVATFQQNELNANP